MDGNDSMHCHGTNGNPQIGSEESDMEKTYAAAESALANSDISISTKSMHQLGDHFNKHGKEMGFNSKKEYNAAARAFVSVNQINPLATVREGTWNGNGIHKGARQRAISFGHQTAIIDCSDGQIIDFFTGDECRGLIDIVWIRRL